MGDIDLVPDDYRRGLRLRRWLRVFVLAYVGLLVGGGSARAALSYGIDSHAQALERLRHTKSTALHAKLTLEELRTRQGALARRVGILDRLRGGTDARRVFEIVERALDERVWFLDWQFMRAGELAPVPAEERQAGYFIIVPSEQPDAQERAWRLRTHMAIRAQALDHSALADFVQRLSAEPSVEEVKVLNTLIREYTTTRVVDFEIGVVMGPEPARA